MFNTKVWLYSGLPLDSNYEHTIYFSTRENQNNFFTTTSFLTKTLFDYSYVRPNKNAVIIEGKRSIYETVNYIRFINDSKYFYAFVESIEYLNENATIINFSIDALQTYLLDCDLKRSYIVRRHTNDLTFNASLQPEPTTIGDYTYKEMSCTRLGVTTQISDDLQPLGIAVESPYKRATQETPSEGNIYNNIYTGLNINAYSNADDVNTFLAEMAAEGKSDSITSVYMYPSFFPVQYSQIIKYGYYTPLPSTIDGYVPKNKKLFTFPYNCLSVSNGETETDIQYELWEKAEEKNDYFRLNVVGQVQSSPIVTCYPVKYRGKEEDFETQSILSGYPQCAYNIDTYKEWLAQNKVALAISGLSSTATVATQLASKDVSGAISTAFSSITNYMKESYEQKLNPVQTKGATATSIACSTGALTYHVRQKCITSEQARKIDSFFSAYGYAVNRVEEPIFWIRPVWNFIQVEGLNMIAKIPQDAVEVIKTAFRRGITFWKDGENMLRYDLDNSYNV